MNVREIVEKWLNDNGYDGLWNYHGCGCSLKDFVPCDNPIDECEPGYEIPCNCGEGCNPHIGPKEKDSG
jgi:hypothetical protein